MWPKMCVGQISFKEVGIYFRDPKAPSNVTLEEDQVLGYGEYPKGTYHNPQSLEILR